MEVTRVIEGSKEKLFTLLNESLLEDIKDCGNSKITLHDIKEGYTYEKQLKNKFGKEGKIRVTITKYDMPNIYEASFLSAQGVNTLTYKLEDEDDSHFRLVYNESFISNKTSGNLNFSLMSKLFKRSNLKKANLILDRIENIMQG